MSGTRARQPKSSRPRVASPALDHRVVMASAGTGKTYQLTSRMIALIMAGADPSEIVATTFTRKAAGEILERVVERLADAAERPEALAQLSSAVGMPLTHEQCADAIIRLARSLDRVAVLTIDSLFGRMANVLSIETGGPVVRRIIEPAEDDAIRTEAMALALDEAPADEVLALVRMLYDGKPAAGVLDRIEEGIQRGLAILRETSHEPALWEWCAGDEPDEAWADGAARALRDAPLARTAKGAINGHWAKALERSLERLASGDYEGFLTGGIVTAVVDGKYHKQECPNELRAIATPIIAACCAVLRCRLRARARATRDLLLRFETVYERLKRERGVWCFEDVPRTLLSHVRAGNLDRLYYRLDARVRHLLLDEFQDTSMVSFRLLRPIVEEIVSSEPTERSFFCVGDVKQSLYVWNRAEPELLPALPEHWPQLHLARLDVSRRSSPVVLDAVNSILGNLAANRAMTPQPAAAVQWDGMFAPHQACDPDQPGEVRIHIAPDGLDTDPNTQDEEQAVAPGIASLAADRVADILARCPEASVAVLVRANADIASIVRELAARGIPSSEEGGSVLYDAAPAAVIRSLLHMLDHPADSAARYHVATSPLGAHLGLTPLATAEDAGRVGARLRCRIARRGLASTLANFALVMGPATDARGLRRLEQVIELARRVDGLPGASCARLVELIDREKMADPGAAGVRVMTIHASKGLEFDAVVLPGLEHPLCRTLPPLLVDRESPLDAIRGVACRPTPGLERADPEFAALAARARERETIEGLCVLYVALTRARHALEIVLGKKALKEPDSSKKAVYPCRIVAASLLENWPNVDGVGEVLRRTSGDWTASVKARATTHAPQEPSPRIIDLKLRPATRRATGRLAIVSPSGMEGGDARTLDDILRPASDAGRLRGTLLHALFELVGWIEDGEPSDEAFTDAGTRLGASEREIAEAVASVREALVKKDVRAALSRASLSLERDEKSDLWRERSFAVRIERDGEASLLTGQFDRVGIVRDGDGRVRRATLVDFKTDAVRDAAMLASRVEHYRPQIQAYREALGRMLGLAPEHVRASLVFTETGRVIDVEASPAPA